MRSEYYYKSTRIIIFLAILSIISISGYWGGKMIGINMITGFFGERKINAFLFYRPAFQYFEIFRLINSGNEYDRISGYYSLIDNNIIDEDFLIQRFNIERQDFVKRTIIWVMGYSKKKDRVSIFFNDSYNEADISVKKEILRSLKRMGRKDFDDFVKKKRLSSDILMNYE